MRRLSSTSRDRSWDTDFTSSKPVIDKTHNPLHPEQLSQIIEALRVTSLPVELLRRLDDLRDSDGAITNLEESQSRQVEQLHEALEKNHIEIQTKLDKYSITLEQSLTKDNARDARLDGSLEKITKDVGEASDTVLRDLSTQLKILMDEQFLTIQTLRISLEDRLKSLESAIVRQSELKASWSSISAAQTTAMVFASLLTGLSAATQFANLPSKAAEDVHKPQPTSLTRVSSTASRTSDCVTSGTCTRSLQSRRHGHSSSTSSRQTSGSLWKNLRSSYTNSVTSSWSKDFRGDVNSTFNDIVTQHHQTPEVSNRSNYKNRAAPPPPLQCEVWDCNMKGPFATDEDLLRHQETFHRASTLR